MKTRIKFGFPLGAIASILLFIYLITNGIWYELSFLLKFLVVIGLAILFFCGDFEYEHSKEERVPNQ